MCPSAQPAHGLKRKVDTTSGDIRCCVRAHTYLCSQMCTHVHKHLCIHSHVHICSYLCTFTHTWAHRMLTLVHVHAHLYMHILVYAHVHT